MPNLRIINKTMVSLSFKIIFNASEERKFKIGYNGKHKYNFLPQSLSSKKYWNSKLEYGRCITNYLSESINYHDFGNSQSLSKRHAKFNLIRGFKKLYTPPKFIIFLMCLKRKDIDIPLDLIKIIFRFLIIPRKFTSFSGSKLERYVMVKDLGSLLGTSVKVNESILESQTVYILSENPLVIEKVKGEGIFYQEGNFFRGIPRSYICVIPQNYSGNLEEDREIEGECGFPYLKCIFNGIKYFLVATENKYSFFVGRSSECDIFLDLPTISRVHCIVEYQPSAFRWVIYDGNPASRRKSINGTYKLLNSPQKKSDWVVAECNEIIVNNIRISFEFL